MYEREGRQEPLIRKANRQAGEQATVLWLDRVICLCLRHWLTLVLVPLLLFTSAPFLAPVAMASGWEEAGMILYLLYSPFCHQLPQRSWFLFGEKLTYTLAEINQVFPYTDAWHLRHFVGTPTMGWKVAWSDRMISFYWMTPVWGVLYALLQQRHSTIRSLPYKIVLLALAPLLIDGLTHLVNDTIYGIAGGGFRDTNAWLTWLTANAFPGFYAGDHVGTFNWWTRLFTGILAAWGLVFGYLPWLNAILLKEAERTCHRGRERR
jgi:uncharacterized membrane protein